MTGPDPAETPAPSHRSDAANWAGKVDRLEVEKREGVRGTNVSGRRLAGPVQGFGKMWQKTFSISGLSVTPEYAIAEWRAHFPEFWPAGNRFAASLTGISPGEVALLDLSVGGTKLSTGVLVLYVDERSFTFMTPRATCSVGGSRSPPRRHLTAPGSKPRCCSGRVTRSTRLRSVSVGTGKRRNSGWRR